jgi:uncharacterized protein
MSFGLRETDLLYLHQLFANEPTIEQVWLYGSRAKGTHRPGSDVDLALVGPNISRQLKAHIHAVLEENSPIPYFFDVVHWNTLANESFKINIRQTAQVLYQRPA